MKFRILTSSQRRRERVFDLCLLMYFIGATLRSVDEAYLLQMGGSVGIVWACMAWLMQKIGTDKLWFHIVAIFLLLVCMYLAAIIFRP